MRTFLREAAAFAFFVVLTIALTWPLAIRLDTAVSDDGDPLLNAWIVDWDVYAFTHAPLSLYQAPIFHPAHLPLAFSENLVGIAIFALPFRLLGASPLTVYNLMVILGFALSGYGAFVLAREVTRNVPASLIGGIFYAFVSFKFDHLPHLQFLASGWLPLMLAALLVYRRAPTTRNALLLAGAFAMNGLTNVHYFLFGSFALVITILVLAVIGAVQWHWRWWARLAGALVLGGAILLPFLLPYRIVSREYNMRRWEGEVRGGSAILTDWLVATRASYLYGDVADPDLDHPERHLFPGVLALFLLGTALVVAPQREEGDENVAATAPFAAPRVVLRLLDTAIVICAVLAYIGTATRNWTPTIGKHVVLALGHSSTPLVLLIVFAAVRLMLAMPRALGGGALSTRFANSRFNAGAWAGMVWIVVGFLGSFGLNGFLHTFLYRRVSLFQSVRAPARWAIVVYVGLAVWSAVGAAAIFRARRVWRYAALFVVALLDVLPSIHWFYMVPHPKPAYVWMREQHGGPTLELPVSGPHFNPYYYMLGATQHHTASILNGVSGFEPPLHAKLSDLGRKHAFDDAYVKLLEDNGCRFVLVHTDWLYDQLPALQTFLDAMNRSGRIRFLRRFDFGVGGDWLFAVTRNVPDWPRYRDTRRDPAGLTPDENFARWVAGQPTYNATPFGSLDLPRSYEEYHGPLQVAGWAISPNGLREVRILIDNGRWRYQAWSVPRGDVTALYPWYRNASVPGFALTIPKRPKGVRRNTDIQIEIVDSSGHTTRFADRSITWD